MPILFLVNDIIVHTLPVIIMVRFKCDPRVRQDILASILNREQFHDVDLVAQGGIRFPSHRFILGSSCQMFHDILTDHHAHLHTQEIHLPDFEPKQVEQLLDFIYGHSRAPLTSELGHFLALNRAVTFFQEQGRKRKRTEDLKESPGDQKKSLKVESDDDFEPFRDDTEEEDEDVSSNCSSQSSIDDLKVKGDTSTLWATSECLQLLINSYATLNIEASSPLSSVDFESQCQTLETEAAFRALIGLRQLTDGSFEGQALAYSQLKAKKMAAQFDEVSSAIREVTGFSAGHWLFQSHYFTRQGLKVPKVVESLKTGLKERMEPFSSEYCWTL